MIAILMEGRERSACVLDSLSHKQSGKPPRAARLSLPIKVLYILLRGGVFGSLYHSQMWADSSRVF